MSVSLKKPNLVSVTTINEDGSRNFLHPADVRGNFTFWRRLTGFVLIAVYVILPWIQINGYPALFFDLLHRRFHFFGLTFVTEDLWVGFFLFTGLGFTLFYVTALAGRLWCGWTCPYTVFLEYVFRRIERFIDGDAPARRKLEDAPWTWGKISKRAVKHLLFLLCSTLIAHIFVSYFVSIPRLYEYMRQSAMAHAQAFGVMLFLTGTLYFCFAWFREQFCIILCPYGRIQSALTDDDTMVIGYDRNRGEPRGKVSDPEAGDCVNCGRCVQVCPTGIDIRNGLQLECIGCANCIDACNEIMDKVGRSRGLVRYDSLNGLEGRRRKILRPRVYLYTGFLLLGFVVMTLFIGSLRSSSAEIHRMRGQPYYLTGEAVRNQYEMRLVNKRNVPVTFTVRQAGDLPEGLAIAGLEEGITVGPQGESVRPFFASIAKNDYKGQFVLHMVIEANPGNHHFEDSIDFLGPSAYLLNEERRASASATE